MSVIPYYRLLVMSGFVAVNDMILPFDLASLRNFILNTTSTWDPTGVPRTDIALGFILALSISPFLLLSLPSALWWAMVGFSSSLSMYYLVWSVTKNRVGSVVAAMYYGLSPYFFNNLLAGFSGFLIVYPLFPLSLVCITRGSYPWKPRLAIGYGAILGIMSMLDTKAVGMSLLLLLFWSLALMIVASKGGVLTKASHLLRYGVLSLSTALGVSAVWIVPTVSGIFEAGTNSVRPDLNYHGSVEEILLWSRFVTPIGAILNTAPSNFLSVVKQAGSWDMYLLSSLIIGLIGFSALLWRKDIVGVFISLTLIGSSILSAGSNLPVSGGLYVKLYQSSLIFASFNRPYFFQALTTLLEGFSLGAFVPLLAKIPRRSRILAICSIFLVITIGIAPVFTGDFGGALQMASLPPYYTQAMSWLQTAPSGVALFLPAYSTVRQSTLSFQNPLIAFSDRNTMTLQAIPPSSFIPFAVNSIYLQRTDSVAKILGVMGIKYIILDLSAPDYSYAPYENVTRAYGFLAQARGIHEVWSKGPLRILENDFSLPVIFAPRSLALAAGGMTLLPTLSTLPSFDLDNTAVLFSDQLGSNNREVLGHVSNLLVQDNDWIDLFLNALNNSAVIQPWRDASALYEYGAAWTTSERVQNPEVWRKPYFLDMAFADPSPWVLSEAVGRNVTLSSEFTVRESHQYELWAKVFYGFATVAPTYPEYLYSPAKIQFSVDGNPLSTVDTYDPVLGRFEWVDLGTTDLASGRHHVEIVNERGLAIVSTLIVASKEDLLTAEQTLSNSLVRNNVATTLLVETPAFTNQSSQFANNGLLSMPSGYSMRPDAGYAGSLVVNQSGTTYNANIWTESNYLLGVRAASDSPTQLFIEVDGNTNSSIQVNTKSLLWYPATNLRLSTGVHRIRLFSNGPSQVFVDSILIQSSDGSVPSPPASSVSYHQVNFAKYLVTVTCSGSCLNFIVLAQPYASLWKARPGTNAIPTDGFSNGFFVQQDTNNMLLVYSPQDIIEYGTIISIVSLLIATIVVVGPPIRKLRQKKSTMSAR
jgi:hypothetical protein